MLVLGRVTPDSAVIVWRIPTAHTPLRYRILQPHTVDSILAPIEALFFRLSGLAQLDANVVMWLAPNKYGASLKVPPTPFPHSLQLC